jgi:uncharacterized protein (TIGR02001 family)
LVKKVPLVRIAGSLLGVLACLAAFAPAQAAQLHASIGGTSDYVAYGLTRSRGEPVVQAHLAFSNARGLTAGAAASGANLYAGPGISKEFAPYLAHRAPLSSNMALGIELTRYIYPDDTTGLGYDYTELRAGVSWRELVEVTVAATPDLSMFSSSRGSARDRTAVHVELTALVPLSRRWSLTSGAGYADLSDLFDTGYWYYSAGAELRWRDVTASLVAIGTDSTARALFRDRADETRLVAALLWRLH